MSGEKAIEPHHEKNQNCPNKMSATNLGTIDDLVKKIILDPYLDFRTFKYLKAHPCIVDFDKIPDVRATTPEIYMKEIMKIIEKPELLNTWNIPKKIWLDRHLCYYADFLKPECQVFPKKCSRFSTPDQDHVEVIAKEPIPDQTVIKFLVGKQCVIKPHEQIFIEENDSNFSIMVSSRTGKPMLFLGPAALCNHDCSPNCQFISKEHGETGIKTIKPIAGGDEILVSYSTDYFGPNNSFCECNTCKKGRKGYFLEPVYPGNTGEYI